MIFAPKMKIYTVHNKPEDNSLENTIFIPEGFSWKAFVFNVLWLLYHRVWLASFFVATMLIVFSLAEKQGLLDTQKIAIIQLGFLVIVGYHANDWRRASLRRKGYTISDVVASDSNFRARQRYFDSKLSFTL